jgi:CII-binding regulator of phage lambda lysogenization HflD
MKNERETFTKPNVPRTGLFWPLAVLLVFTTVAVLWVGLPLTPNQYLKRQLQPPAQSSSPDRYAVRLNAAEQKLNAWPTERAGIVDRITQVEKSMTAGIRKARNEATALVEGVKRDMGRGFEAIQTKVTGIESRQTETHEQLAKLEGNLMAARHELEAMRETNTALANHVSQVEHMQLAAQTQMSGMQNRILEGEHKVDAIAYQMDRRRIDFEVSKDRADEVADGIHVTLTQTDTALQQVSGWVQIAEDGRFVWLREAGVQHPIPFVTQGDERTFHLVFTGVKDGTATGYLLLPRPPLNTAALR